ncbi:MAG: NAD-dependent epimerase/dehydratase family protein [Bacteroidetes bacterium]|nr:NAD-dependent epimerase/dehydratase family protein [Bacteroidota bacterium]
METRIAAVIGASGLIGSAIVHELLQNSTYSEIRIITRRSLQFQHEHIREVIVDFENPVDYKKALEGCSAIYCAVGTTNKKVKGNKDAYRKVDYQIPVQAAQFGEELGIPYFTVVSSVGANDKSSNFYLQLKGEMESKISQFAIYQIAIFRPSMLLGKRNEFRLAEKMASIMFPVISFLFPSKYKPIQAHKVAKAMVQFGNQENKGIHILHYKEILNYCK